MPDTQLQNSDTALARPEEHLFGGRPLTGRKELDSTASRPSEFDEFIYILSHDLRGSIRALVEVPQWIGEDLQSEGHGVSDTMQDYLKMMETHARRLDYMLGDLLTYSRIGRLQTVKQVNLQDVLQDVITAHPLPKGFEVMADFQHTDIPMGTQDIARLFQALVSNAVKHHDRASGRMEIGSRRDADDVILSFRDDGPGVPVDQRDRIFKVMTTLRPRDEVEGSGMGLAWVKKIVEVYEGRLEWSDSFGDRGTAFTIAFPLHTERDVA